MEVIKGMSGTIYLGDEKIAEINNAVMQYEDCEIFDPPLHGTLDKEDTKVPDVITGNVTATLTRRSRRRFYRWARKTRKAHKWTIEELIERQRALNYIRRWKNETNHR